MVEVVNEKENAVKAAGKAAIYDRISTNFLFDILITTSKGATELASLPTSSLTTKKTETKMRLSRLSQWKISATNYFAIHLHTQRRVEEEERNCQTTSHCDLL